MPPSRRTLLLGLALAVAACAPAPAPVTVAPAPYRGASTPSPLVVYLVRHAEKTDTSADPLLSSAGTARAVALRAALRDAGIGTIVVSDRRRTLETARPLAELMRLEPVVVPVGGGTAAHVAAVAEAVRRRQGNVLVVGHSNTVPAIIRALGGPPFPDICDAEYANLYVLVVTPGQGAQLARTRFGAADAPDTACAAMQARE